MRLEQAVNEMVDEMSSVLAKCKRYGMKACEVDVSDPEVIAAYSLLLIEDGITVEDLRKGKRTLFRSCKFFPTAADLVEILTPIRDQRRSEEHTQWLRSLVPVIDENGVEILASPESARRFADTTAKALEVRNARHAARSLPQRPAIPDKRMDVSNESFLERDVRLRKRRSDEEQASIVRQQVEEARRVRATVDASNA